MCSKVNEHLQIQDEFFRFRNKLHQVKLHVEIHEFLGPFRLLSSNITSFSTFISHLR